MFARESETQKLLSYDHLIFFNLETTHDQDSFKFNYRKLITDLTLDLLLINYQSNQKSNKNFEVPQSIHDPTPFIRDPSFPNIIQMDW